MRADRSATDDLRGIIAAAASYLPAQGPITTFIHHNTLHAFEDLPFEDAVVEASRRLGTQPFLDAAWYGRELARGRIRVEDVDAVLASDGPPADAPRLAGDRLAPRDLARLLLLNTDVGPQSDAAARWTLTETDAVRGPAADTAPGFSRDLWHACLEAASLSRSPVPRHRIPVRHRDLLLAVAPDLDVDALVHPLLIRLAAAFLDQGVAAWPMPGHDRGFLAATSQLYAGGLAPAEPWAHDLRRGFRGLGDRDALEVVAEELGRLGIPAERWDEFVTESLLALRGWAGMFHQLERRPDLAPVRTVRARLADFLAVRLVLDRAATQWAARRLARRGHTSQPSLGGLWTEFRDRCTPPRGPGAIARALLLHRVCLLAGLSPHDVRGLDGDEVLALEGAILALCGLERRRLLQLAYERRHRRIVFDALATHRAAPPPSARPLHQSIVCIDDRLESLRRHLEELGPDRQTFGAAGFFAVVMYYRGLGDWHAAPLCPIVLKPEHTVLERAVASQEARVDTWRRLRRLLARPAAALFGGGRSPLGSMLAVTAGAVAAIPLVARVVFPRFTGRISRSAEALLGRPAATRLALERTTEGRRPDGTLPGFDVDEMTAIVRRLLEDIGLTAGFARLVAVLGHGASSRNNPHESAYNCGACGGGRGGPSGRAFAAMANDPRVRERLAGSGIMIPADTSFLGGAVDTCADTVEWFDVDRLPPGHADDFRRLAADFETALAADALERCRRFEPAAGISDPRLARRHVEARADDLAEVRPELGHATNAVCLVGRRSRSRGLFLDRRAFLVSYDPTASASHDVLVRTLAAIVPVCVGINLEYLFSTIDGTGYGCGTKLPHNITGLLGVMDGHASDLRTGLPRQMVEVHEPVRLLLVIDGEPASVEAAIAALPGVERLVANRWLRLAAWDARGDIWTWAEGRFERHEPGEARLPAVDRSVDWFAGRTGHLLPAAVLAGGGRGAAS